MPKGIAINVGLNFIDKTIYGTDGALKGCVNDANAMQAVATSQGFETKLILNEEATHDRIVNEISKAGEQLLSGDIFLLTLACHGSQIPSLDNNDDEVDGLDETWVLFDQQLIDDELNSLLSSFRAGVRVLIISDSCHSGTMTRVFQQFLESQTSPQAFLDEFTSNFKPGKLRTSRSFNPIADNAKGTIAGDQLLRALERRFSDADFGRNNEKYREIQENLISSFSKASVKASVILLSGCQDNQLSADGINNGLFTETLLKIWSNNYIGNYITLFKEIRGNMPPWQTPNFYRIGSDDSEFENQKPFAIVPSTLNKETFMSDNTGSISTNDSRFLETLAAAAASAAVSALIQEFRSPDRGFGISIGGGVQTPFGGGGFNIGIRELVQQQLAKEGVLNSRAVSSATSNDSRFLETLAAAAASAAVSALIQEFRSSDRGFGISIGGGVQTPFAAGGFNIGIRELVQQQLTKEGVLNNRAVSSQSADRSFLKKLAEKVGEKVVDVILQEF